MTWSYILLNREKTYDPIAAAPTTQARQEAVDRLVHVIAHELVHGLGLLGHPDPERFPDSALRPRLRLIPGAVLFSIDRDVLVASHTLARTIGVAGNRFVQAGGAQGTVTGVFAGPTTKGWAACSNGPISPRASPGSGR